MRVHGSLLAVLVAGCALAHAQDKPADYPRKPIRIVVGIAPSGGLDLTIN